MNREPCRIDDDPSYDYSDYCEGKGYYKEKPEQVTQDKGKETGKNSLIHPFYVTPTKSKKH